MGTVSRTIDLGILIDGAAVPGAAVAVLRRGAVDLVTAAGSAAPGQPMTATTRFDCASLSKPVFATFVCELAARGVVDLDEPLPTLAAEVDAVDDPRLTELTPRLVLLHRSGFPNWRGSGEQLRLETNPGDRFGYSGEAFDYLLTWLRRRLPSVDEELDAALSRAGMTSSSFSSGSTVDAAAAHPRDGTVRWPAEGPPRASGSLVSSAKDLASYVAVGLASPVVTDVWATPDRRDPARTLVWARAAGPLLWQHGDSPGLKHLIALDPRTGDGMVVLTNGDRGREVACQVASAVLGTCPWRPADR